MYPWDEDIETGEEGPAVEVEADKTDMTGKLGEST